MPLAEPLLSEVIICLGNIPLAEMAISRTLELSQALAPLVPENDAILMSRIYGVVTYGDDLHVAYMRMETVEHFARIALVTHLLGRQKLLTERDVEKLQSVRAKYVTALNHGHKAGRERSSRQGTGTKSH